MIDNVKSSISFPEIGQIRKGDKKTPEGYVGKDLGNRFRIIFYEGDENARSQATFQEMHETLLPTTIVFTLPFLTPWQCWESYYEAYTAGRMVARADKNHFIRLIDPKTGKVIVSNSMPDMLFQPGQSVGTYTSTKGKEIPIIPKPVGRLRLVIPELARFAFLTFMTTSIYDCIHIRQQLEAIEYISRFLPSRNGIAGIPLIRGRRMTEITWSQPDGSAKRVKSGLVYIEADPVWVKKMLASLSANALPAGYRNSLLPEVDGVHLDIHPNDQPQANAEADGEDGSQGDDPNEAGVTSIPEVALTPEPVGGNGHPPTEQKQVLPRPWSPEFLKERLAARKEKYNGNRQASQSQRNLVAMLLQQIFAGDEDKRKTLQLYLFDQASLKDISDASILVILNDWLKPKSDSGGDYHPDPVAVQEALAVYGAAIKVEGQIAMKV